MPSRGASAGWLLRGRAGAAVWAEGCFPRACGGLGPGGVRMRGRSDGGMTTPCRPSVAWHVPVRGPLEFPGVRGVRVPTAQKLASQRISAGQRHVLGRAERAACKTVGSAYDGSNPSPATTCGNGPLAAMSRARRAVLLVLGCVILYHRGPSCCGVHGRMADGICAPGRSGHLIPRTATDGGRVGGVFRLDVWGGAGACIRIRSLAASETVTLAGRPERARVARAFPGGIRSCRPCGVVAVLRCGCCAPARR
jgi:hypothetical protein